MFKKTAIFYLGLISLFLNAASVSPAYADGILLILNKSEGTVSFIDAASDKPVGKATTGQGPHEIVASPDGKYAYVSNYGVRGQPGNTLSVIDLAQKKELGKIDLGAFKAPHGIASSKNGKFVYVTCEGSQALVVVDTAAKKVVRHVKTDQDVSHMVVLSPDETRAYVANIGSNTVTVIDLQKDRVLANVPLNKGPEGIDLSPDGKTLYVANRASDNLSIIDTSTNQVTQTVPTGTMPIRVKVTRDGRYVLISNTRSNEVQVLDASTRKDVTRIKTKQGPVGLLVAPDSKKFYVANSGANLVSVVEIGSWRLLDDIKTGAEPDGLGFASK